MGKISSFNMLAGILIIIGTIFLLENTGLISGIIQFWPITTIIIGIGFCMLFFKNRKRDIVLISIGTFLLLNSIFFIYLNFTTWSRLATLWPIFIITFGTSFISTYIFSRKNIFLYLAMILIALGTAFIIIFAVSTKLWPITLILAGISFATINIFERYKHR